jgi:hypothetical protein
MTLILSPSAFRGGQAYLEQFASSTVSHWQCFKGGGQVTGSMSRFPKANVTFKEDRSKPSA